MAAIPWAERQIPAEVRLAMKRTQQAFWPVVQARQFLTTPDWKAEAGAN